ncbi:MAG: hypothetical protein IJI10_11100 [Eubacterium sp.]|nr:hypothetical protein [Eubacterium sp.]
MSRSYVKSLIQNKQMLLCSLAGALLIYVFLNMRVAEEEITLFGGSDNPVMLSAAFAGILICILLWHRIMEKVQNAPKASALFRILELLVCIVLSGISIGGHFYRQGMSLRPGMIFANVVSILITLFAMAGGFLLYYGLMETVRMICLYFAKDFENRGAHRVFMLIDGTHSFRNSALFLLICWLPQILIRYPGVMCADSWKSIHHYWNPEIWSSQHPILFTLALGKFADLGISSGHIERGLFLIVLLQIAAHILIMAYSLNVMKRFRMPRQLRLLALFFFAFLPVFSSQATMLIIDSGYCCAFLLLLTELSLALYEPGDFIRSVRHCLLTILAVAGMFLRYNGIYIMLIVIGSLLIRGLIQIIRRKEKAVVMLLIVILTIVPTAGMQLLTTSLTKHYVTYQVSGRAKSAMMIQQIARCAVEHPESFSDQDEKNLYTVIGLTLDETAEKYNPDTFDDLKEKYNLDVTAEEMAQFRALWIKMLKKHPGTCINALLHQNYYLFDLLAGNTRYYEGFTTGIRNQEYRDLYTPSKARAFLQHLLVRYYYLFAFFPAVGIFTDQAIYTLILIVLSLMSLSGSDKRNLVLLLPLLGTVGIVLVGPACFHHPRYTYPLFYTLPLMLAVTMFNLRKTSGRWKA